MKTSAKPSEHGRDTRDFLSEAFGPHHFTLDVNFGHMSRCERMKQRSVVAWFRFLRLRARSPDLKARTVNGTFCNAHRLDRAHMVFENHVATCTRFRKVKRESAALSLAQVFFCGHASSWLDVTRERIRRKQKPGTNESLGADNLRTRQRHGH